MAAPETMLRSTSEMPTSSGSDGGLLTFRLRQGVYSFTDQVLSVGGMFLVNLALARTISKPQYGVFTLAYSVFTFLAGLHNAALLEAYTVYGAGRYRELHPAYAWLIWRSNATLGFLLTGTLLLIWFALLLFSPALASGSLLGVGLTSGIVLTASLLRRMLYVQRRPGVAATFSAIFFVTVTILVWAAIRVGFLNGLSAFLIVTLGWIAGGLFLGGQLPKRTELAEFLEAQPNHWSEHWRYSRWVLATAFVFQLTTQGYYWIVAGFLSLKEVAELRAMYMLVSPVDQIFTSVTLIILPALATQYASKHMAQFVSLWKKYLLIFFLISASYTALSFVAGHALIHLLYGGKFDEVAPLFVMMATLPIIMGVGNTINAALKAAERPHSVFYAYAASGTATLFVGIPLVMRLGLRGAVYGMLFSGISYTGCLIVQFMPAIRVESPKLKIRPDNCPAGGDNPARNVI
jgi:O-antigen/teichoic acid export membrane protein